MQFTPRLRLQTRVQNTILIILLLLLTGLLAWLSTRYTWQADVTHNSRHSLSEMSLQVLAQLHDPVNITAYVSSGNESVRNVLREFLLRYQRHKKNLNVNFVDPDTSPGEVRERGIQMQGELFIEYQGRSEHLQQISEQELTNTLQGLARADDRYIVFLEGHGERSPVDVHNYDVSDWAKQLKSRGFKIQALNFAKLAQIPDNTSVLVVASPRVDLLAGEVQLLNEYVEKGGNLLWLLDLDGLKGMGALADKFGLKIQPGTVVDPSAQLYGVNQAAVVAITEYGEHPITEDFRYLSLFPQAAALKAQPPAPWEKTPLFTTNSKAWSETDELRGALKFNPEKDVAGPLDIGLAFTRARGAEAAKATPDKKQTTTEKAANQQRVVIIGDGDFLANSFVANAGNLDLGLKIVNWLARDDHLIAIAAKSNFDTRLELSPLAAIMLGVLFLLFLPLSLLGMGVTIWLQRRKA
ncbi:MAG: GldG family protein [Thiotrichaceae bacterium]|nr:GldG family protein [Thiotrichaceae bacterium]